MKNLKIYLIIFISLFITEFTQAQAPKEQILSFVISEGGISKIYTMNTEGQNQRFLAKGGCPRFSPDGGKIAFVARKDSKAQIHIMNTNGSKKRVLETRCEVGEIDWTPDGNNLVYTGYDGFQNDIFIINREDGSSENLTQSNVSEIHPKVSPDGKKIAFSIWKDFHIHLINIDGTGRRALTIEQNRDEARFDWSQDGEKIVFSVLEADLYLVDVETGREECLTKTININARHPVFSPNGEKIAFCAPLGRQNLIDIFVIDADGKGNVVNLTNTSDQNEWVYDWFDPDFAYSLSPLIDSKACTWGEIKR